MLRFARRVFEHAWFKTISLKSRMKVILWNRKYNKILDNEKFRIVIFLSIDTEWDCFNSLYRAFHSSQNSEVVIVADDFPRKSGMITSEFLKKQGFSFVPASKAYFIKYQPHVIFIADEISVSRNDWIFRVGARVVYIPYGTSVSAALYSEQQQYNLPLHNSSWRIFVTGDFAKELYGLHCDSGNDHVVAFGHPKTEVIYSKVDERKHSKLCFAKGNPVTFLWNIHFDIRGRWSTWNQYGICLLRLFESRDDVELICRPHPFFFDSFHTEESREIARRLIVNNENTYLDEETSMADSFAKCDALITDGSSIMYDFCVTEKPMLYLRSNDSYKLHKHCFDIIKSCHYIGDDFSRVIKFVDMVANGNDALRKIRSEKLYGEFKIARPINVGSAIKDYIEKELNLLAEIS